MYDGGHLINKINKLTTRKINELLKDADMDDFNGSQGTILHILWKNKEMTIKEISKSTGLAKTSLTSMLTRMEEKGLIEKIDNDSDKRSTIIRLTDKSKSLEDKYNDITNEMIYQYYSDFTTEEIEYFENQLRRVLNNLERNK